MGAARPAADARVALRGRVPGQPDHRIRRAGRVQHGGSVRQPVSLKPYTLDPQLAQSRQAGHVLHRRAVRHPVSPMPRIRL